MTPSPVAALRRSRPVAGLLAVVMFMAAVTLLGTPRAAHADPIATCAAPSDLVAHPSRSRLIYATCTPNTAVPASVTIDPPAHGAVVALSNLTFQYTAAAGYTGPVSFTVHPVGGDGQAWPAFTVALDASTTRNTPPNCGFGSAGVTTRAGSPVTITLNACDDAEGDPVTVALTSAPAHGTAGPVGPAAGGSGYQFTYTPDASFSGSDTIGYAATDDHGGTSSEATIGIDVHALGSNAPPTCTPNWIGIGPMPIADAYVYLDRPEVYLNCQDADGDPLTVTFVQPPEHGTVALVPGGSVPMFTYTATNGYTGLDSLVVDLDDGQGGTLRKPMTIAVGNHYVRCSNRVTVAVPARTGAADPGVTFPQPCTDPDGDPLTSTLYTPLSHGAVRFDDAGGTITYTPDVGFSGDELLEYQIDDGHFGTNYQSVQLVVGGAGSPGPPPVARRAATLPPSAQQRAATQAAKLLGTTAKPLALGLGTAARGFLTGAQRVAPGDALATVSCAKACTVRVDGRLTLTPQRHGGAPTHLTLAHRTVKAKAGHTAVVRLVLTKAQRARLAHARRATVALALRTAVGKRAKTVHRTFTVARS